MARVKWCFGRARRGGGLGAARVYASRAGVMTRQVSRASGSRLLRHRHSSLDWDRPHQLARSESWIRRRSPFQASPYFHYSSGTRLLPSAYIGSSLCSLGPSLFLLLTTTTVVVPAFYCFPRTVSRLASIPIMSGSEFHRLRHT